MRAWTRPNTIESNILITVGLQLTATIMSQRLLNMLSMRQSKRVRFPLSSPPMWSFSPSSARLTARSLTRTVCHALQSKFCSVQNSWLKSVWKNPSIPSLTQWPGSLGEFLLPIRGSLWPCQRQQRTMVMLCTSLLHNPRGCLKLGWRSFCSLLFLKIKD